MFKSSRKIVFLFGAGASYGAGDIVPECPPLGSHLFEKLCSIWPSTWGKLPENIKNKFKNSNFESGMEIIYSKFGGAIPKLMQEMAIYFVQFRPYQHHTLYNQLLRLLTENSLIQKTFLSTINYDCVLEYALLHEGISFDYFFESEDKIPILKLHGSCNFFCNNIQGKGIQYGTGVIIDGGITASLDPNWVIEQCLVKSDLAPVMCLYMREKPLNISPSIIKNLQENWSKTIIEGDLFFCIGAKPLFDDDTHIWDPINNSKAEIYYIGSKSDYAAWQENKKQNNKYFLGETFRKAFPEIEERLKIYATHQ